MGKFSDILLTVDYDRTLTAPDSSIPERNLEAIRYFMEKRRRVHCQHRPERADDSGIPRPRTRKRAAAAVPTARRPMIWRRKSCCSAMKFSWTCGRPFGSA